MQVKVYCTKRLLKNGIWKNTKHLMMVINIKVRIQGYQYLTNTLWIMCHMNGATSDVDKFFLKGKDLLKEDLKKIFWWIRKRKDWKCPARVYR